MSKVHRYHAVLYAEIARATRSGIFPTMEELQEQTGYALTTVEKGVRSLRVAGAVDKAGLRRGQLQYSLAGWPVYVQK